jgi:hypothetical protein
LSWRSGIEVSWHVKEERHARMANRGPATETKPVVMSLDRLWSALPDDGREQILKCLSQIVARQLPAPPAAREVQDENC